MYWYIQCNNKNNYIYATTYKKKILNCLSFFFLVQSYNKLMMKTKEKIENKPLNKFLYTNTFMKIKYLKEKIFLFLSVYN